MVKEDRRIPFLALILSLPSQNTRERMRAWRTLRTWGCAVLRDGVYLLPAGDAHQQRLTTLAAEVRQAGGQADVLWVTPQNIEQEESFRTQFDRSQDYDALLTEIAKIDPAFPDLNHLKKNIRSVRRRLAEIIGIDFFPTSAHLELENRLTTLEREVQLRLSPGEPTNRQGGIQVVKREEFSCRIWATRRGLGVDRFSSAWLIQRFIDPAARFFWFGTPKESPKEAVGFDFDGGRFSHVGARVTFETLLASFELEGDPALSRIARMVHSLDVGGDVSCEEAAGFSALFKGMKLRIQEDDALLEAGKTVLDDYYRYFSEEESS
ncbi:MAG: chromate resistance protein [Magnetococcales bacterium]|nr:chromate resistance protein [Magnetococcales bacterium]NGZ26533.1 chromate resistance protein [Magnetococcales bacterium]